MDSCAITKCPICEKAYKVYAFTAENQSACPACKQEAEKVEQQENKKTLKQLEEDLLKHGV